MAGAVMSLVPPSPLLRIARQTGIPLTVLSPPGVGGGDNLRDAPSNPFHNLNSPTIKFFEIFLLLNLLSNSSLFVFLFLNDITDVLLFFAALSLCSFFPFRLFPAIRLFLVGTH